MLQFYFAQSIFGSIGLKPEKKVDKEKGYDKKDAQRVAGFIANRKRAGAGSGPTAKMKKREGSK